MKLSSNFIGALIFTALAIAAFVWMAMRPVVEGNAMSFGMPAQIENQAEATAAMPSSELKTEEASAPEAPVSENMPTTEASPDPAESSTPSSLEPENNSEPVNSSEPAVSPEATTN